MLEILTQIPYPQPKIKEKNQSIAFTEREIKILKLFALGNSYEAIAATFKIKINSVKEGISNIGKKMRVHHVVEEKADYLFAAIMLSLSKKWIPPENIIPSGLTLTALDLNPKEKDLLNKMIEKRSTSINTIKTTNSINTYKKHKTNILEKFNAALPPGTPYLHTILSVASLYYALQLVSTEQALSAALQEEEEQEENEKQEVIEMPEGVVVLPKTQEACIDALRQIIETPCFAIIIGDLCRKPDGLRRGDFVPKKRRIIAIGPNNLKIREGVEIVMGGEPADFFYNLIPRMEKAINHIDRHGSNRSERIYVIYNANNSAAKILLRHLVDGKGKPLILPPDLEEKLSLPLQHTSQPNISVNQN